MFVKSEPLPHPQIPHSPDLGFQYFEVECPHLRPRVYCYLHLVMSKMTPPSCGILNISVGIKHASGSPRASPNSSIYSDHTPLSLPKLGAPPPGTPLAPYGKPLVILTPSPVLVPSRTTTSLRSGDATASPEKHPRNSTLSAQNPSPPHGPLRTSEVLSGDSGTPMSKSWPHFLASKSHSPRKVWVAPSSTITCVPPAVNNQSASEKLRVNPSPE